MVAHSDHVSDFDVWLLSDGAAVPATLVSEGAQRLRCTGSRTVSDLGRSSGACKLGTRRFEGSRGSLTRALSGPYRSNGYRDTARTGT